MMTTAATTTQNGDFFRLGSFRLSSRSSAKREKIRKLNNNQMGGDRPVVYAVREENGEKFRYNGFRLVQMGSNWFRWVQMGSVTRAGPSSIATTN
jgi:hypothetical protein